MLVTNLKLYVAIVASLEHPVQPPALFHIPSAAHCQPSQTSEQRAACHNQSRTRLKIQIST